MRRSKGELPQLPACDAEAEAAGAGEEALPSLQQAFYRQINLRADKQGAPPRAASDGEGIGATAERLTLEEEEKEEKEDEGLGRVCSKAGLENEGFGRLRSAPSRAETMKMMPRSLLMVHQEINGLLPSGDAVSSGAAKPVGQHPPIIPTHCSGHASA